MPKNYKKKKQGTKVSKAVNKAISKKIKLALNANLEKKFLIVSGNQSLSTTWSLIRLTGVPQSSTVDQSDSVRIGDAIRMTSLRLSYSLFYGDSTNVIRVVAFQYKLQDDNAVTAPVISQIVQSPGTYPFLSTFNHDHLRAGDFHVLYDRVHFLSQTAEDFSNLYKWKRNIRLMDKWTTKNIEFIGGTANGKQHIYLAAVSDSGAVSHPNMAYYSKLTFTDA